MCASVGSPHAPTYKVEPATLPPTVICSKRRACLRWGTMLLDADYCGGRGDVNTLQVCVCFRSRTSSERKPSAAVSRRAGVVDDVPVSATDIRLWYVPSNTAVRCCVTLRVVRGLVVLGVALVAGLLVIGIAALVAWLRRPP